MSRIPCSALVAAILILAGSPMPATAQEDRPPERTILDERPGDGEVCLVCKQVIYGADVLEIRYKGRRFFVQAGMLEKFDADPERYFADLQARSGLFDEHAVMERRPALGWLVFGVYVVVGLVFAALCGYLAVGRGHAPLPWFFAGLVGNVAALFVLLAAPRRELAAAPAGVPPGFAKVPVTWAPVACPHCGGSNHPSAPACGACRQPLTPAVEAEKARI